MANKETFQTECQVDKCDVIRWVINSLCTRPRQKRLVQSLLDLYVKHTSKSIILMDMRDISMTVATGMAEKVSMDALTEYYFEEAYNTLEEAEILNNWLDSLKQMNPPPSGLDILDIISDDIRKSILWKKAVEKLVYRFWKRSWRIKSSTRCTGV